MVGGRETEAEEIVQETWIRAVRGLPGFEWRSTLRTWLTGIAVNCFREHLRRRRRGPGPSVRDPADLALPDARTTVLASAQRIDLERAIAGLPDGYREVLILHDVQGYTHAEIAGLLGIAPGTSKSQLARGRRALRKVLGAPDTSVPDTSVPEEERESHER